MNPSSPMTLKALTESENVQTAKKFASYELIFRLFAKKCPSKENGEEGLII